LPAFLITGDTGCIGVSRQRGTTGHSRSRIVVHRRGGSTHGDPSETYGMTDLSFVAMQRYGFGPSALDRATIGDDPRGWLRAQLAAMEPPASLAALPSLREAVRNLPRPPDKREVTDAAARKAQAKMRRETVRASVLAETLGRYSAAVTSPSPFRERLVHFWTNHFTVSGTKPAVQPLAGCFEREAIRPHVTGRFEDLLLASTRHPAMLIYLDNVVSVGANSVAGKRRKRGLNENLAREILELHTLGVDGGYTQADVVAFANVLTGWGYEPGHDPKHTPGFRFFTARHQPGAQTLLGKRYAEDGAAQGETALRDLARAPATARFIARKLARHFIADDPPASAVDALARRFRESDGNLVEVYRTLIDLDAAWRQPLTQYKPPERWLIGAQRLLGQHRADLQADKVFALLQQMGQKPYAAPSPAGWADSERAWLSADGLWKRLQVAQWLAARSRDLDDPAQWAESALDEGLSAATRRSLRGAESRVQAIALLLASPELNRA
jgi:uncharacterized protein (DUF1800 family)